MAVFSLITLSTSLWPKWFKNGCFQFDHFLLFQPLSSGPGARFPPALGHRRHWQLGESNVLTNLRLAPGWEVSLRYCWGGGSGRVSFRWGVKWGVLQVGCPGGVSSRTGSRRGASHPSHMQGQKEICKGKLKKRNWGENEKRKRGFFRLSWQVYGFLLAVGLELIWEIIGKQQ